MLTYSNLQLLRDLSSFSSRKVYYVCYYVGTSLRSDFFSENLSEVILNVSRSRENYPDRDYFVRYIEVKSTDLKIK